jgi:hypothetical protein
MRRPVATDLCLCVALLAVLVGLEACLGPSANHSPVAFFVASPESGYAPLTVELDARASHDPDGDPLTYAWTVDGAETASGAVVVQEFDAGTHTVELQVADNHGAIDVRTRMVAAEQVPAGYVPRRFSWTARDVTRSCTLLIPWDLYQMYKARIRNTAAETYAYGDYVVDPLDDPTLRDYADVLWAQTDDTESFVANALAFVQTAIRYRPDPLPQDWPWYPLETLVAGEGDCEDTAILFVSLLRARSVPSSLAFADTNHDRIPDHVLALVPVSGAWASRLTCSAPLLVLDGIAYAVAETAGDGPPIPLGCDPWSLAPDDVYHVWPL